MTSYRHAIVRQPGENFAAGLTESGLGCPDYKKALAQHSAYVAALESCGVQVTCLPADLRYPDGCFVEDCVVMIDGTFVITNPGHQTRKGEVEAIESVLEQQFNKNSASQKKFLIERIEAPGTVDGGDVLRVKDHFVIGLSNRTNAEGAHQLGEFVEACGMTYSVVIAKDLHLKTSIAYGGDGLLVCTEEYNADEEFLQSVAPLIKKLIVVSKEEKYSANCLRVNDTLLLANGFQTIYEELSKHLNVVKLDMSEFRKMDGGLTCLSVLV